MFSASVDWQAISNYMFKKCVRGDNNRPFQIFQLKTQRYPCSVTEQGVFRQQTDIQEEWKIQVTLNERKKVNPGKNEQTAMSDCPEEL